MTRIIDEQLSALVDGELPGEQESMLLSRLDREPSSRRTLARYALIGDVLRGIEGETSALSISERVSAAITAESLPASIPISSSWPSSTGAGFIGAGIAASIALLVVVSLADIDGAGVRVLSPIADPVRVAQTSPVLVDELRLTRYLVAHAQFSNVATRRLVNSHVTMPSSGPADWMSHE